jgi:hypothetical protein
MGQLGMDNPYALATMGTHDQDWTKYIHTHKRTTQCGKLKR